MMTMTITDVGKAGAGSIPRTGIGAGRHFQKTPVVLRRRVNRPTRATCNFMGEDTDRTPHAAAQAMLDAFASVGADRFDVTWTNSAGDPRRYDEGVSLADLIRRMPAELDRATRQRRNLIVRPHGPGVTFLQLDDLSAEKLARCAPPVFLAFETSPGNFQDLARIAG